MGVSIIQNLSGQVLHILLSYAPKAISFLSSYQQGLNKYNIHWELSFFFHFISLRLVYLANSISYS